MKYRACAKKSALSKGVFVLLALAAIAVLAGPTHADTINLAYEYVEAGAVIDAYLGATRYYWGSYGGDGLLQMAATNPSGPVASELRSPLWAFCMEINQYTTFTSQTYGVEPLASVLGSGKTSLIQQLFASHFDYFSRTSTPVFYGGAQGAFVAGEPANNAENLNAIALVYAIFEVRYDYDGTLGSLNLSAGQFRLGPNQSFGATTVRDAAQAMLDGLIDPQDYTGYMPELFALTNPTYQDLITDLRPLPEPATMGLLAIGGLAVLGRRRKR